MLEATTGGTRRHLRDLVTHVDPNRFSVSVLCSAERDPEFLEDLPTMEARGVDVTVIPMVRHISLGRDRRAFRQIVQHVTQHPPDIVHTHASKAGFLGRAAAARLKVPVVVHTPHVFPFQMRHRGWMRRCFLFLERWAADRTDRLICLSRSQRNLAALYGISSTDRLTIIENGIEAERYQVGAEGRERGRAALGVGPDDPVVLAVGRLVPQKGHEVLLQAAAQIVRQVPSARFVFVGEGELRESLQQRAREFGVQDHIVLAGRRPDIADVYAAADIVAFPSLWEGVPYALLEAMAAGKAIVAAAVGGIPDVVARADDALLVPPEDPEALAREIQRLLKDVMLRKHLGANAKRAMAERFRLSDMVRQVEDLYESTLDAKRHTG